MSTLEYQELLNYVANRMQELSLEEQVQLLNDLSEIIDRPLKKHNALEFRGIAGDFWKDKDMPHHKRVLEYEGIGQEAWKETDVKVYMKQERESWDE